MNHEVRVHRPAREGPSALELCEPPYALWNNDAAQEDTVINRRRPTEDRAVPAGATSTDYEFSGELLYVTSAGPRALSLDCLLDFGAQEYMPGTVAVELSQNRALALFEESLLQRWIDEGCYVVARLVLNRDRPRVVLSVDDSALVLPVASSTTPV